MAPGEARLWPRHSIPASEEPAGRSSTPYSNGLSISPNPDEAEASPGESPVMAEAVAFREYTDSDI
jgi:hypothetical protein